MELGLAGKTAIVTGGSLGIGRAIARELAQEGVSVAIVARDAARLEAAAAEIARETNARCVAVPADLVDPAQVEAAVARAQALLGHIDILVNNAGATPMGRIADTPDEIWMKSINLKLMGYMRCARLLTPAMRARKWGRVINIIGRSGHQPRPNYITGSAVNASLLSFTLALAAGQSRDMRIGPTRVETNRNFATKLWNTSRFCEMNGCVTVPGFDPAGVAETANKCIVAETARAVADVTAAIEALRFNDAASAAYHFVYDIFCDWYIEITKPVFQTGGEAAKTETRATTAWARDQILKLLLELRGSLASLLETQKAKWTYMMDKINAELAKPR